ncbi:hypothetical protein [Streptomyces sp. NPDC050564]|uniref:hypothetical protein n=1 Tax=Streptomyces sp. NPDC050564 TaxID=3365631 RepID=UPI00378FDCDC
MCRIAAQGLFLSADAAQFLQHVAHCLGAEVVAAFGRAETLGVQDLRDGRGEVPGRGEFTGKRGYVFLGSVTVAAIVIWLRTRWPKKTHSPHQLRQ